MNSPLSFTTVRSRTIAVIAAAGLLVGATGCSSESASSDGTEPLPQAAFQLGWIPNVESMGPINAEVSGYFAEAGTDVELLPGGPEVTTDAQIVSGNALMGSLSSEGLANAVTAGAPLVAIGAIYQTSPSAIVSLADAGIDEPKDLEGRKFGIAQTDARVYTPFFELTGVDAAQVTQVQTGTDPASLISGEVDAISGTLPNQVVALEAQGLETQTISLADYGYNRWSGLIVVRQDSLEDPEKRATIVGMLGALMRSVEASIEDPRASADAVLEAYGEQLGLDAEQQYASAEIWADLSTGTGEPVAITPEGIEDQQAFFDAIGIDVDAEALFDLSVQEEL